MINKDDYSMKNKWTRDDLPHQHEVWDDFVTGKHSDMFHAVDADDLGEVLDEIVDHLNAHHPKSQPCDCGETIDALNRNRDALVENRDKSISLLQRLLTTAEADADRWRRAHSIVERERDEWKARTEAAEWDRDDDYSERNQKAAAWDRVAAHPALRMDLLPEADHTYAGGVFERITQLAEAAEARTAPAVTKRELRSVVAAHDPGDDELAVSRVNALTDRLWSLVSGDDPAEAKARELWEVGKGMSVNIEFDDIAPDHRAEYLRIARHLLGQEDRHVD